MSQPALLCPSSIERHVSLRRSDTQANHSQRIELPTSPEGVPGRRLKMPIAGFPSTIAASHAIGRHPRLFELPVLCVLHFRGPVEDSRCLHTQSVARTQQPPLATTASDELPLSARIAGYLTW